MSLDTMVMMAKDLSTGDLLTIGIGLIGVLTFTFVLITFKKPRLY